MKNHWSCTKFADWIRGTPKFVAGTSKEWRDWRKEAKTAHPIRFWVAEEGLDRVQDFIGWPLEQLYNLKYYINNRWVTKTHQLTAHPRDIKPGQWQDVGYRFLPCLFNELVDFVEIELAWSNIAWDENSRVKYNPPFWACGWFRWRTWRSPEAGLDYLNWASQLTIGSSLDLDKSDIDFDKPTSQAISAKWIKSAYLWWTTERPARETPEVISGWNEYYNSKYLKSSNVLDMLYEEETPEEKDRVHHILEEMHRIEQEYEDEDSKWMKELIDHRHHLWT